MVLDELHVVVVDGTGDITGFDTDTVGNRTKVKVIETFGFMSKNSSMLNHHKVIVFTTQM